MQHISWSADFNAESLHIKVINQNIMSNTDYIYKTQNHKRSFILNKNVFSKFGDKILRNASIEIS
jgi:hypothetical protein